MTRSLDITILGLSITSSWGNGHATTYRGLVRALVERGHRVRFLERDVPWYADNRDLPKPPFGATRLYGSLEELKDRYAAAVRNADLVIVGSYVPDGVAVSEWATTTAGGITAFYDIDTPVTLSKLARGDHEYIAPSVIPKFDLYLSFTGGPTLARLEREYGARLARPLYCAVDPELYFPERIEPQFDLGYMGTYSDDRQPVLQRLLLDPARRWPRGRFVVAGPKYPESISWRENVERIEHLPPAEHRRFYNLQRYTLNVTRADMVRAGYAPSVRLFEAAACATPIISDWWNGLEQFLRPGREILIARSAAESLRHLREVDEDERHKLGRRARARVLAQHTAAHRAEELEECVREARKLRRRGRAPAGGVRSSSAWWACGRRRPCPTLRIV
jgi:spore maturation protein CgeB